MKKLSILFVLLLTACQFNVSKDVIEQQTPTSPFPYADWMVLSSPELGIEFRFPPLPGEIWYEFSEWPEGNYGPASEFVNWQIVRDDLHWTYSFAGCTAGYVYQGRESWITDLASWYHDNNNDFIVRTYNKVIEVVSLKRIVRDDGSQGLIFDPPDNLVGNYPGAIAAILNLPESYNLKIKCMSFLFVDSISLDDIEIVLNSISYQSK